MFILQWPYWPSEERFGNGCLVFRGTYADQVTPFRISGATVLILRAEVSTTQDRGYQITIMMELLRGIRSLR
jgi:hypothetical protein